MWFFTCTYLFIIWVFWTDISKICSAQDASSFFCTLISALRFSHNSFGIQIFNVSPTPSASSAQHSQRLSVLTQTEDYWQRWRLGVNQKIGCQGSLTDTELNSSLLSLSVFQLRV